MIMERISSEAVYVFIHLSFSDFFLYFENRRFVGANHWQYHDIASELKNGIRVSEKNVVDVCVNFFALYEHTMSNQANEHANECVRKREFDGNTSASGYTWIFNMPIRAVCAY